MRFTYKGMRGYIDQHNFVQWGGMGFHREDIHGPFKDFLDAKFPNN